MAPPLQNSSPCDESLLSTKRVHRSLLCKVRKSVNPLLPHIILNSFLFVLVYKKYGSTCLSSAVFWNALPVFWISDADAIKTVHSSRVVFPKDIEIVGFGRSVGDAMLRLVFSTASHSMEI